MIIIITSEKEAVYHIYHTEQQYEWGRISKIALKEKLKYFLDVLGGYNYAKAESERIRVNRKYDFSL